MERCKIDEGWRFHLGDIKINPPRKKAPVVSAAKVQTANWGPASPKYLDCSESYGPSTESINDHWETVDLPHDYEIREIPSEKNNEALGFVEYKNAWYRKRIRLEKEDSDKRIVLFFEGVATEATVWVNGCLAGRNFEGHNSFEIDVTDFVYFGAESLIAVHVNAERQEGWWYSGGGIYRHVWLEKYNKIAIDRYGVYLRPKKKDVEDWALPIDVTIRNDGEEDETLTVVTEIKASGDIIAKAEGEIKVERYSSAETTIETTVKSPRLWDTDDPFIHTAVTRIYKGEDLIDEQTARFGFREAVFDPDKGLILNGRSVKIKGVCCHQDYGLTGIAVPDSLQRYRIEVMKQMGANGYRTAHYPQGEATMDALDEMGFLVMDETRWFTTNEESMRSLEWLIKRDRNRPSVVMWSIGNEEWFALYERGRRIAKKMREAIYKIDRTRPVTMAVSHDPLKSLVPEELDLIGINYSLDLHEGVHEKFPQKPFVVSECSSTGSTRGWYFDDDPKHGYVNEYDGDTEYEWARSREETWKHIMAHEWISGGFQWAGIEHRGEALWPRLCSQSGAVDMFLLRKAAFYQNKSHWDDEPMIYLMPHWNHKGREGEKICVRAYTNCEEAALYLDGELISRVPVEKYGHADWFVPFKAGKISVKGFIGGKEAASDCRETSDDAAALRLKAEMQPASDGYAVLTCFCEDGQGRPVPDAECMLSFSCDGGVICATGSDVADHIPPDCPDRRMRAGECAVLIKVSPKAAKTTVYARSPGLASATLTFENAGSEE